MSERWKNGWRIGGPVGLAIGVGRIVGDLTVDSEGFIRHTAPFSASIAAAVLGYVVIARILGDAKNDEEQSAKHLRRPRD